MVVEADDFCQVIITVLMIIDCFSIGVFFDFQNCHLGLILFIINL